MPQLRDATLPPSGAGYWCATTANYDPNDRQKSKLWGFCNCTETTEYEGVPSAAPTPAEEETEAPTPNEYEGAQSYITSGGYVANDSPCMFPLTFNDGSTYTSCIPFSEKTPQRKGQGGSGTPPRNPSVGDKSTWCYSPPTAAPTTGETINYSTLPKAQAVNWGYCRSTLPTDSPTSASPTVRPTTPPPTTRSPTPLPTTASPTSAAPTAGPPVTSGGYVPTGTVCKIPFVYVRPNGRRITFPSCAPFSAPSLPFVNANNPPAQPTPPATNGTWYYVGAGAYDPSERAKRQLWGFCDVAATVAPSTLAPTTEPPSVPPSTAAPTTEGQTDAPTGAPTTTPPTLPPVTLPPFTIPPSSTSPAPTSSVPTSSAPTTRPPTATTAPSVTIPPTARPTNATGNNTRAPTLAPTNASGNVSNQTASPTSGASVTSAVAASCVAAAVAIATFVAA